MSTRNHDSKQAQKLPQFPPRKVPARAVGQSPARGTRIEPLPGVSQHDRSPWRPDPSSRARTGVEKLAHVSRGPEALTKGSGDLDNAVNGFDSPQAARIRSQVARDEVLSYMQQRRIKNTGTAGQAAAARHDTVLGDSALDNMGIEDAMASGRGLRDRRAAAAAPALPWEPRAVIQAAVPPFVDNDLVPSSMDQSPTRHAARYATDTGVGSTEVRVEATGTVSLDADGTGGWSSVSTRWHSGMLASVMVSTSKCSAALTEDAFDFFKREVAAKVIQTYWRRWQAWKSKVRREAEERILQELLSDNSGLSLRLLLNGDGRSDELGLTAPRQHDRPANSPHPIEPAPALEAAPQHSLLLGRPGSLPGAAQQAGRSQAGSLSGPDAARPVKPRPVSAVEPRALASRGRSPARPRATAPAALSPAQGTPGRMRPTAHRSDAGGMGTGFGLCDGNLEGELLQRGDSDARRPQRKLVGGHTVYTFVATPQKSAAGAAAAVGPTIDDDSCGSSDKGVAPAATPSRASSKEALPEPPCRQAPPHSPAPDRGSNDAPEVAPPPDGASLLRQQSSGCLTRQVQPSLDADTNPAMASPELSTANSNADSVLGPASPAVPALEVTSRNPGLLVSECRPRQAAPHPHDGHEQQRPPLQPEGQGAAEVASGIQANRPQQPRRLELASQPDSALPVSPGGPGDGQQEQQPLACSPSPQRQARNEALQRLKRQGSQRLSAQGPRPPSGLAPAPTAPDTVAARPREAAASIGRRAEGAEADGYPSDVANGVPAGGVYPSEGSKPSGQGVPGGLVAGKRRCREDQLGRLEEEPQEHGGELLRTCAWGKHEQERIEERDLDSGRGGPPRPKRAWPMQQGQSGATGMAAAPADEDRPRRCDVFSECQQQSYGYGRELEGEVGERNEHRHQNCDPKERAEGHPGPHAWQQPRHLHQQLAMAEEASLRSLEGIDAPERKRQQLAVHGRPAALPEEQRRVERQQGGRDEGGCREAAGRQARPQHAREQPSTAPVPPKDSDRPPEKAGRQPAREDRARPQRYCEVSRNSSIEGASRRLTDLSDSFSEDSCKGGGNGGDFRPSSRLADDMHHVRLGSSAGTTGRTTHSAISAQRSLFRDDSDSSSSAAHDHVRRDSKQLHQECRVREGRAMRDTWALDDDIVSTASPRRNGAERPSQERPPLPASACESIRSSAGDGAAAAQGPHCLPVGRDVDLQAQHPSNADDRPSADGKVVAAAAAAPPVLLTPCELDGKKRNGRSSGGDVPRLDGAGGPRVANGPNLGVGVGVGTAGPGVGSAQQRAGVDASVTAEKMTSILKYLEEVELQAEQEATCAAIAPALLATEPTAAAAVAAALLSGTAAGRQAAGQARRYTTTTSATSGAVPAATNSSRPGTAQTAASQLGVQTTFCDALLPGLNRNRRRSRSFRRRTTVSPGRAAVGIAWEDGEGDDEGDLDAEDGSASAVTASAMSGVANRPAFLAESVYENVRSKIRRLQDEVKQRDVRIAELSQEVEALQAAQRTSLMEADARLSEMLAAQRAEYEAAVSRHLAFVDRLLADKEALASRAEQLSEQLKGAEDRQERAITKLKEGWAAELKRQKESWAAAEKQRREAWMQSKAAEIKDVTVKGLEGEVQKLLSRHRAELSAAQQAAADEAKRHLDTYVAQNEAAVRQLKERMAREAEEAVEKERSAAATRLREVSERYEQQLQTQRMRLVADADLRLEQLEQARKEDKKRYDEGLTAAREAGEARLREAEEDWRREKEALRKAHDKQIDALREQYETGQEGWRAAMAERARKEVAERVAAIREKLLQERNEEIQAVMTRLEAEHASAVEALKEDFCRREEAAAARAATTLKEARRAEAKMAERFRNVGLASKTAEERLAASELSTQELRRELESKNNTIRWLEAQVTTAKEEAAARERDVRSLGAEKAAVAAEVAAAVARDKQQVEARLTQALQEAQELRARHSAEMAAVETRVRATLARKDEVISGLRDQLANLAAELRTTQEVLRQQHEELGSDLDGGGAGRGSETLRDGGGRRGERY